MTLGCRMDSLRFLLRDRDTKYTHAFDAVFQADDMEILLSPPRAPRANAICERAVGTLRREILDHILIYNEAHAAQVLTEYIQHYNGHRPHQSRRQLPPDSAEPPVQATVTDFQAHPIRRQSILGGLINEYPRRLTERHRRSAQRRIQFSSGTGCTGRIGVRRPTASPDFPGLLTTMLR